MKAPSSIHGVVCAMLTSFDEQHQLDLDGSLRLTDFLIAGSVHGLMVGGTTGEGLLLSLDERKTLLTEIIRHVQGRVPVIAHTGCVSTADTIDLTEHAQAAGATVAALIVPYFFTFDDQSLCQHFASVAKAVPDFPLFIYTFPGNAKNDISPQVLAQLRQVAPNIVGIKSSSPDLDRFQQYLKVAGDGFAAFNGADGLMLPALALGAVGQVSGNANVYPEVFRDLYNAHQRGDMEMAREKQILVNGIRHVLKDGLHPAYFKAALALRGVPVGTVRLPMRWLSDQELKTMKAGLQELGLHEGV